MSNVIPAKPGHLGYITKQRLPFSPDVEAAHWHHRQSSEKIIGVRLSLSADAKALIVSQRSRSSRLEQSAAIAAPPSIPLGRHWPKEIHAA